MHSDLELGTVLRRSYLFINFLPLRLKRQNHLVRRKIQHHRESVVLKLELSPEWSHLLIKISFTDSKLLVILYEN